MLPNYIKISQFPSGGTQTIADVVTGLRTGVNTNFNGIGPGGVIAWNKVTSDTTMLINNGYVPQSASTIIFYLPSTAPFGSIIRVTGAYFSASTPWVIQCGASQIIYDNTVSTNNAGSGAATGTNITANIELLCTADDTAFQVLSSNGTVMLI